MTDTVAAHRADARPLAGALAGSVALGAFVGVAIGGAYWAGGAARDQVAHSRIERLAGAAVTGFSNQALHAVAARQDPAALAVAQRQDETTLARLDLHTRRMDALDERLRKVTAAKADLPDLPDASLAAGIARVVARPFHMDGALGETRDLDCLTDAVYYEARGESAAGQAAVAQVVLNRVRHPAFPKSVCGVVFQHTSGGCQFSFACNGAMGGGRERGAWDRARKVAADALGGAVMADVGESTHFQARSSGFGGGLLRVAQIGAHVFYRFGGRAGSPAMFRGEVQPSTEASPAPRTVMAGFLPISLVSTPPLKAETPLVIASAAAPSPKPAAPALLVKTADVKLTPASSSPPATLVQAAPLAAKAPTEPTPATPPLP